MKIKIKNTLLIILNLLIIFTLTSPTIFALDDNSEEPENPEDDVKYSLSIQGDNTVEEGKTVQLSAYLKAQDTTTKIESGCIWSSSDESIATISDTGLVTAKKAGVVTITANHKTNSQDLSATHQITVTASSGNVTPDPNPPASSDWTDMSNVSFKIVKENSYYYICVSGLQYKENHSYYFLVSNSNVRPTGDNVRTFNVIPDTNRSYSISSYIELSGDIYVWFYEEYYSDGRQTKEHFSTVKLERPALNSVGSRMHAYFFNEYTSTYINEFYSSVDSRTLKIKIGYVNDINILKNIRDKKANCLVDLLNYAKNADSVYVAQVPLGQSDSITSGFDIKNKEYFYVYMELDDENGKYSPLEDVSLYQGCVSESVGKNLFDYLSDSFKWELDEGGSSSGEPNPGTVTPTDPTQATTPLPDTGKELLIAILVSFIAIGAGSYIIYRKYKDV